MLREAAEVLTVFTSQHGLVLVFEDLYWSHVSALEWLSYIAQRELARAAGLRGRARRAALVAERARVNVTKRIKIALRQISERHPALGEHLTQTIRTGAFCVYAPSAHQLITWQG